ncbi:MAG: hypothetical protein OEO77_13900, partial [Acidimicrobiia bacterium]|nr:hypothetical protein [Acidimicrobiia bacterium]
MTQQRIVWTVFPNGAAAQDDGSIMVRFSALVSPRLTPTAATGQLPDFEAFINWPNRLETLEFQLAIGVAGGPVLVPAARDTAAAPQPDPVLWGTLFGSWTTVTAHDFNDHSNDAVLSYPEAAIQGYFQGVYSDTTLIAGTTPPTASQWQDPASGLAGIGELFSGRGGIVAEMVDKPVTMGYIPLSDIPNPVQQLSVQDLFLGGGSPMGGGSAATDPPP